MPLWKRLLITLAAMLAASFLIGLAWHSVFNVRLPSYLGGVVGGLTAIPVWEFLKRVGPRPPKP
jgi:glucose-6-phosphate-specific signal transduction histidine kinase